MTLHKKREILLHAAFWAVYASFIVNHVTFYQTGPQIHWGHVFLSSAISIGYLFILSYVNYFWLVPVFLLRRRVVVFSLLFVASFAVLAALRVTAEMLAFGQSWEVRNLAHTQLIIQSAVGDLFIVLFIVLLRFATDWPALDSRRRQLETETLNAEIRLLKAQVNPHFLFNTLNNLYYLSTIKSDTAPQVISKLSEVMRYMIYDANYEKVELAKEIDYMRHYIGLERLRLRDGIPLEFEVYGNTDLLISPLILITFLENAFKHGVDGSDGDCWIRARLVAGENGLRYTISNSKAKRDIQPIAGEGIGLSNVKRRLALCYPNRHHLDIQDTEDSFFVNLTIERP